MKYESTADIYSANRMFRQRLMAVLDGMSEGEANALREGETWSVSHVLEHLAMVNNGMAGICGKLIGMAKAAGAASDGTLAISDDFFSKIDAFSTRKAEAPERVRPTGTMTVADSLERLAAADDSFAALQHDFENVGLSEPKFPHPYFGDLTATEWFVLCGLHEHRHTGQVEDLLAKIRQ